MNRMWIRISLTFIAIVVFVISIPLIVMLTTNNFVMDDTIRTMEEADGVAVLEDSLPDQTPRFFELADRNPGVNILRFVLAVTGIGIAVGVISSRGLSAPLSQLAETAEAIGSKDLSRRVDVKGTDEVRGVARAFNQMAQELELAETLRNNLLSDVAHELRTPISIIQGNLRAILDDVYELDKSEISKLYDQTLHITRLVDDLRLLAQAEAQKMQFKITSVDLKVMIEDIASMYQPVIEAEGLTLHVELPTSTPSIAGDRARLTQCILNLLNNAIMHTSKDGMITIRVIPGAEAILLMVEDSGSGIDAEHLPYIFDRFYRADPSRTRETGGSGLGLAITRAIVEAHGGEITAESERGVGTKMILTLPLVEQIDLS